MRPPFTIFVFSRCWNVKLLATLLGKIARHWSHWEDNKSFNWTGRCTTSENIFAAVSLYSLHNLFSWEIIHRGWQQMVQGILGQVGGRTSLSLRRPKRDGGVPLSSPGSCDVDLWLQAARTRSLMPEIWSLREWPVGLVRDNSLCGFCRGQGDSSIRCS